MEQRTQPDAKDVGVIKEKLAACKRVPIAGTNEVWILMPAGNPRYRVRHDPGRHRFTSGIEEVEQSEW